MTEEHTQHSDDCVSNKVILAVKDALGDEGYVTTSAIVLTKILDPDGGSGVWIMVDDGMHPWDVMGLLEFAQIKERFRMAEHDARRDD